MKLLSDQQASMKYLHQYKRNMAKLYLRAKGCYLHYLHNASTLYVGLHTLNGTHKGDAITDCEISYSEKS